MQYASLTGMDKKRLRVWLALFFLGLVVPTVILIVQAFRELKWEAFHQYRLGAEELAVRIDDRLTQLVNREEARPFTDYAFLNVVGDPSANFLQRSPLSSYPVDSEIPGMIGYFQVDAKGILSTPLVPRMTIVPSAYGVSEQELQQRKDLAQRIQQILTENGLVQTEKADKAEGKGGLAEMESDGSGQTMSDDVASGLSKHLTEVQPMAQAAFDQLQQAPARVPSQQQKLSHTLGRIEELKLDYRYQSESAANLSKQTVSKALPVLEKRMRKERSALPEPSVSALHEATESSHKQSPKVRIRTFESEIDPFAVSLLDSGQIVLFRKVWRDGQRYIQGALIERQVLLHDLIEVPLKETSLSQMSDLILAYQGNVFSVFSAHTDESYLSRAEELQGAVLLQTRLTSPFNDLELIFNVRQLPAGAGVSLIAWIGAVLFLVLSGGFYFMYRLGVRQIDLVRQQQDFVSAVSHELKTPLTSIRMYGEILRVGWASEEKKKTYYDYIHDESERLSRLIANVLQLARMTRNDLRLDVKPIAVADLLELVQSRVVSQIEQVGFTLDLNCSEKAKQALIAVDMDAFMQILINLVDNAIKFSARSETKVIELYCQLQRNGILLLSIRDFGPGVPKEQMKKIFKLFYRSENELTRETLGTGIGLALVQQLTLAMKGQVSVINKEPGAEFKLTFPTLEPPRPE